MNDYQSKLKANYLEALDQVINTEIKELTVDQFISRYEVTKPWAIGPFEKEEKYTFIKSHQMGDPTGIEWTSSSIFNPSLVVKDDQIYLFYRAAVKKESLGSRIGLAIFSDENGWTDFAENPIIYPTEDNEIISVEDPKVYKYGENKFVMFYNAVWRASQDDVDNYEKPFGNLACDIKYALSNDLIHWEKRGLAVPYEVSRLWAKGAVIARNGAGEAVKIHGEYMMFLSEGCGGYQTIGFSQDMEQWRFERREYLPLPKEMGTHIYEVACAIVDEDRLVMDFLYNDNNNMHAGAQALFDLNDPYIPLGFTSSSTLAWGGLLSFRGHWLFAQGWDAPRNQEVMYFYTALQK